MSSEQGQEREPVQGIGVPGPAAEPADGPLPEPAGAPAPARRAPIHVVLVANRGEIARRVFRTCRALGIGTVAVHSDPDADGAHVREADAAVRLPGEAAADTYLRGESVVAAALAAGADAVHPGYGFLSESAVFAAAVREAGLTWIGPSPEAVAAMGSKTRAKELMAAAGVPLFAALDPAEVGPADLPVLVKAAAGGGGRGMRVVRELTFFEGELTAARAEAAAAFGDGEVFVEPYAEGARHIEVQVLADAHGTVWTLGERDCSMQRRHQKVVEETPAPGLSAATRTALHDAAARAARAIGYEGAGTVEFLVGTDGLPYFLEMNTRLQVEHPVTECVFGLDLVAWQLRIAEGSALPPEPPAPRGHAIEARLYAEDPARDWQPQAGTLHRLDLPGVDAEFTLPPGRDAGLRLDSGVGAGDTVGVHYDPMLAKVVAWAPTRAEAIRRLAHGLERGRIHGLLTNRRLLVDILRHPDFAAARFDTGFLERRLAELTEGPGPATRSLERLAALAAALADTARRTHQAPHAADGPATGPAIGRGRATVAARLGGWRNLPSQHQVKRFRAEPSGTEHEVRYRLTRDGLTAAGHDDVVLRSAAPDRVELEVAGVRRAFDVAVHGDRVFVDTPGGSASLRALPRFTDPAEQVAPGSLRAPMPGTVVRLGNFAPGDRVERGQPLLWLEAMKMEHAVTAPATGTLTDLTAEVGRQVEPGAVLAVVKEDTGGRPRDAQHQPPDGHAGAHAVTTDREEK
ncbi:propionyl-CoA carboxylase alpha chain [Actinacidiphila yanglinensis]|uniref:Propionyl-CoA carboxylase alpha chain n=1 Tax=Actinacidiphila yanglinensis TaxID=310779 RepID=A0A1H5XYT9_9ACTN|nr:biotin carboxylase N-terminal domain-containing protein [Actinacidiphila yanglinensis]SEG16705.1 propionyl-CoA carboxylase alpha chain [Actinacidiphila yanglinensis]